MRSNKMWTMLFVALQSSIFMAVRHVSYIICADSLYGFGEMAREGYISELKFIIILAYIGFVIGNIGAIYYAFFAKES